MTSLFGLKRGAQRTLQLIWLDRTLEKVTRPGQHRLAHDFQLGRVRVHDDRCLRQGVCQRLDRLHHAGMRLLETAEDHVRGYFRRLRDGLGSQPGLPADNEAGLRHQLLHLIAGLGVLIDDEYSWEFSHDDPLCLLPSRNYCSCGEKNGLRLVPGSPSSSVSSTGRRASQIWTPLCD